MSGKSSRVVQIRLQGGLGNNLFQYAAGKYVALRSNSNLVLDLSTLDYGLTYHGFHLNHIFQDFKEVNYFNSNFVSKNLYILVTRITSKFARKFAIIQIILKKLSNQYYSSEIGYDQNITNLIPPISLRGYFQTWRFAEELILSNNLIINFKNKSTWLLEIEKIAAEAEPIVLHIRRGDYNKMKDEFGLLSYRYYLNALKEIPPDLINKELWVFSDDIKIAKKMFKNYGSREVKFISMPLTSNPAEVLYLMSLGSGHIIANSTFSYWGAYLSQKSKIIIAPSKWFKNWEDPKDLINPRWLRVQSEWE